MLLGLKINQLCLSTCSEQGSSVESIHADHLCHSGNISILVALGEFLNSLQTASFPLNIRILLPICPEAVDAYLYLWQLLPYSEHFILSQFGCQIFL